MPQSSNKNTLREMPACNCFDMGTVIDNEDCMASYEAIFLSQQEAETKLKQLETLIQSIQSDPCEIKSKIEKCDEGYKLELNAKFCCGAEKTIFLFRTR